MKCLGKAATECSQHQHGAESAWEQQPGTGGHQGEDGDPTAPREETGREEGGPVLLWSPSRTQQP